MNLTTQHYESSRVWRFAGRLFFICGLLVISSAFGWLYHQSLPKADTTWRYQQILSLNSLWALLILGLPLLLAWLWLNKNNISWRELGLSTPEQPWWMLIVQVVLIIGAVFVVMFSAAPFIYQWLGQPDYSSLLLIRGNLPAFIYGLILMWITAAFFEELFVRGFLLNFIANMFGNNRLAFVLAAVLSSVLFGLGHIHQGAAGVVQTTLIGLLFAIAYLLCRRNLWPLILAHGLINSLSFYQVYTLPSG